MSNIHNISSPLFEPFPGYLSSDQKGELIRAWNSTGFSYREVRPLLFDGVPPNFFGLLPDQLPPLMLLRSDLNRLSLAERLPNGNVPLLVWLKNATQSLAGTQASEVFDRFESQIKATVTGAPQPAVDEGTTRALLEREAILGEDDSLPVSFLQAGSSAVEAVAKIFVPRFEKQEPKLLPSSDPSMTWGTSWLVAPDVVLTNHHVIAARRADERPASQADFQLQARNSYLHFDFDDLGTECSKVRVEQLLLADATLDFAFLRLEFPLNKRQPLQVQTRRLELPVAPRTMAANIIQHPRGESKRASVRNNHIFRALYPHIEYFSDTDEGSSGAPVCDDSWRVIALHQGTTRVENAFYQGRKTGYINQGIQLCAIWKHLEDHAPELYLQLAGIA